MYIKDGGGGTPINTTVAGVDMTGGIQSMMAIISGAVEIAIDMAQVAEVQALLDQAEKDLQAAKDALKVIPAGAVGGSPIGKSLAHHSSLADGVLRDNLMAMEKGVALHRELIQKAVATLYDTDDGAGATAKRGTGQVEGGAA